MDMRKVIITVLSFMLISPLSFGQFKLVESVKAQEGKIVIPHETYTLESNGLTLILHEDHSDPIVHVQVQYHVGSARESVRNSGFAHFFEHMMFQGSKNVADEEHFEIVSEAGGTNNAYTSFDQTVYINTAPSNLTETLLWLEADRMGLHLDGFTQKKFENQRDAVKNEKRQRYDNQPYGMVNEEMFKNLYPNHPYEWTPIGFVDDLDAASFDDLRNFFLRWYGPNNATLIVSGDFKPEDVKSWVNKYYSGLAQCPKVGKPYAPKPNFTMDRYVQIKDRVRAPMTMMVFPTVASNHADEPALDILGDILGGGNNSIMYKNIVKSQKAFQAGAGHGALELSGFLSMSMLTKPEAYDGLNFKECEAELRKALSDFEERGVLESDLEMTKAVLRTQVLSGLSSVESKATILGDYHMMQGPGVGIQDDLDRYAAVTKEDIIRVYNKYIKNRKALIMRVVPDFTESDAKDDESKSVNPHANEPKKIQKQYQGLSYNPPKDDFDRSKRPTVPAAKGITVPDFYKGKMANGLKYIGTKSSESPLVYMLLSIDGGHLLSANKKVPTGLANLTARMMGEGTSSLTTEEFSKKLDLLGSSISFSSGTTSSTVFISSLEENLDATLALFEETFFKPRFDEEDFKRIKDRTLEGIKSQNQRPSTVANKAYAKILHGDGVLGKTSSGTYKTVSKLKLEDVKSFYKEYYSPNVASLVVSGNITESDLLSKLSFLKSWESTNVTIPEVPEPKLPSETVIYVVEKERAAQSTVIAGHPSLKYDYNGEQFRSTIANFALGGAFNSRININLREDKGYTYGARSSFSGGKYSGQYRFSSDIKKEATDSAISELLKEIKGFVEGGITDEELSFTKSSVTLSEALDYETPFQKLGFLNRILSYDLPANFTEEQTKIVENLTKQEVNTLAKKYLKPDNMIIVVVGHSYKIVPGLKKLGYKVVTDYKVD